MMSCCGPTSTGTRRPTKRGRMIAYKALCDLLWTLWGVIQVVNENPVDDFWAYATNRFERCKTLMSTPGFDATCASPTPRGVFRLHPGAFKHSTEPVWSVSPSRGCLQTLHRAGVECFVSPGCLKHSTAHDRA